MSKILITGASGYLGSVIVGELLEEHEITAYDIQMYDKTSLLQYASHPNFKFIRGDVRNTGAFIEEIAKHDVILPLAALVGAPLCAKNPLDAILCNQGQLEVIAQHKRPEQKVIFNNTNSGYGSTGGTSLCTEETPMKPVSLYGETKCAGEDAIRGVDNHVVFRLATIFGASTRPRMDLLVNNLVGRALKEKMIVLYENSSMRNYLHVKDVARGTKFVLDNWDKCKNEVYNFGNDNINMSKLDLVKEIQKQVPCEIIKAEYTKDPDARDYIVSSQKFYSKGFECKYDLQYGIRELVKVYSMVDVPVNANY